MTEKVISVIIPVYRPGIFFEEAIRSVIEQRFPRNARLELIAVFDGPDRVAEDLLRKIYPSAVIFVHPENRGPSAARNTGIKAASGQLISFIDADDIWEPHRILRDLEVLESRGKGEASTPEAVFSLHQIIHQDESGHWIRNHFNWVFLMGVGMYRREVFDKVGLLDESIFYGEDSDWFFRVWECETRFKIRWEVSLLYRVHEGGMTWGREIGEKGHLQAMKQSLDRRRGGGSSKAKLLVSPEPTLKLSDRSSAPERAVSIFRHCLREKWRYFKGPLPISFICGAARAGSELAKSCRQTLPLAGEESLAWKSIFEKCEEPFIAIEMPDSISHPIRLMEQLATFELFPHTEVALSSYLRTEGGRNIENGNPEISSFLARASLMRETPWDATTKTPPKKAMFSLFCGWRKSHAEVRVMPWALTSHLSKP
ncbi:MAG: glycosyltransferase family A protein [Verrucomicrobiales bacterium]|nr:glycosyltransferase family A protein [Verrucomicrobiales bacterium]